MTKSTFFSRHALLIMFVAVFLLPLTFAGARRALLTNRNDVQDWLPSTYDETREFKWFQKYFAGEQFVLISWEGCTITDQRLKLLVEKLAPRKRGDRVSQPEAAYFQSALTGPMVLEQLTGEPLKLPEAEALSRLRGSLVGPDLKQTCAVLVLSEEGKRSLRKTIKAIYDVATGECNIPRANIHMGGPPVDNLAIDMAGESSLIRLAGIALIIGLVISWWCLRSKRLVALVFFSGIYSAALSLAIGYYAGTEMNAILLTMPSLVYVAAISGAIHLSNYYSDSVHEEGLDGAPGRSLKHAALPLGLATVTTAVGLVSLCYSELVPIQLFGLYSAIGVIASLLLLCLFLPAGFQLWPIKKSVADEHFAQQHAHEMAGDSSPGSGSGIWWAAARFIVDRHMLVTACGLVALAVFGWGMTKITTSVQLMRMFPKDAPILNDYKWLETHLGELVPMEIVLKLDKDCKLSFLDRLELVQRIQKQVETIPEVGSALSAATFAPRLPRPEDYRTKRGLGGALGKIAIGNPYQLARKQFNRRLEGHRDEYLGQGYVAIDEANQVELWRISARVGALKDVDFGEFVKDIKEQVDPILAQINGVNNEDVKAEIKPVAAELGDPRGTTPAIATVEAATNEPEATPAVASAAVAEPTITPPTVTAVYTGLVPLIYKSQRSLLDGLLLGFIMDLVVVTIVMTVAVREWSAGIVLMLPSIFPVFMIFGLIGWTGIIVDTGTVMAPGVALGVTVDDVVHFMLMYRGGLKQGLSRRDSIMVAYKGCGRAMYQSWGVIGLGLSVFALSPFTPTQRFGYLMVTLLTSALIGNLVVLPAVLASPIGALFGRRFQKRRAEQERANDAMIHPPAATAAPAMLRAHLHDGPIAAQSISRS